MNTLGIIGTGVMGTDIAQLAAESGYTVILYDIDENRAKNAYNTIFKRLTKNVENGKIDNSRLGEITSNIKFYPDLEYLSSADVILESIPEDIEAKKNIFRKLDKICKPGTILATNTSSISITDIASATDRPEFIIGIHFLIPARISKIIEIIPGLVTTRETVEMAKIFVKKLGKTFVESKDFPGFLLNRMLMPMLNEAITLLYENAATAEAIDKMMKFGLNLPMGPLELADMIGLDIILAVSEEMYKGYSDPKYRPSPLIKKYVSAGYLGKKSGRGFYIY